MILRLLARGRTGRRTAIPARTVETPRRSSVNLFKGHTSSTSVACAGASTRRMSAPAPPASRARVARRARRAAHRPRRRRRRADLLVRPRERGRVPGPVACRLASYIRSRHSPRRLTGTNREGGDPRRHAARRAVAACLAWGRPQAAIQRVPCRSGSTGRRTATACSSTPAVWKKACGRPRFEASPPAGRRPEGAAADPRGCAQGNAECRPSKGRTLGTDDELNVGGAPAARRWSRREPRGPARRWDVKHARGGRRVRQAPPAARPCGRGWVERASL